MVRYFRYITLFLSLALVVGCNPGITEPDQLVMSDIHSYFWKGDTSLSLWYENYRQVDSSKAIYEYTFSSLAGANDIVSVSRLPKPNPTTFSYKYDSVGSLLARGLNYNTLFPLPDGYEIVPEATLFDTSYTYVSIKKVLALRDGKAVAIDYDNVVYFSTSNGESWQKSEFKKDVYGAITSWYKVVVSDKNKVYAGTSYGYCIVSSDGGKNWTKEFSFGTDPITSIAASSEGNIFATTDSLQFYFYDVVKGKVYSPTNGSHITSLAVCESVEYSGAQHNVFIASTYANGLFYWAMPLFQSFMSAKSGDKTQNIFAVTATGRSTAVALGYVNGAAQKLLYSSTGGQTWESMASPLGNAHFLSAASADDSSGFIIANENGEVLLGTHRPGIAPNFDPVRTSIAPFHINDISMSGTAIIAAVDSVGVMVSTDEGGTWMVGSKGLSTRMITTRKSQGYITLLRSTVGGIKKGDMWQAGVLAMTNSSATVSTALNAEVVEAWSKIDLPFGAGTYENVFEIVYSCTPPNRKEYKVHVFYAKEYGPILFQRFEGSDLIDESYLVKK